MNPVIPRSRYITGVVRPNHCGRYFQSTAEAFTKVPFIRILCPSDFDIFKKAILMP